MTHINRYTDAQIEGAITKALEAQDVDAVPSLIAVLALQNPQRAETIRQTILFGLSIATLDVRWERYLAMFGPHGMPRDAFDAIAAAQPNLGSRGLHRIWITPDPISRGATS